MGSCCWISPLPAAFPPPAALRVALFLPEAAPAHGILRARPNPPQCPPRHPAEEIYPHQGRVLAAVPPERGCRGSARWLRAPRWLFPKFHGYKGSGDATSEPSVFISSWLTPPRGTITKASNLITVMQQSAGEHVSPGRSHPPRGCFPVAAVSSGAPTW